MSDIEIHQNEEYEFSLEALYEILRNDPNFIALLRHSLLNNARGTGNSLGKWAQRETHPPTQQPNTQQRIW